MNNLDQLLAQEAFSEISIIATFFNFIMCAGFLYLISLYYRRFSVSLGSKSHVASILPLIGLTVFIVITVVKSSLALSLGLVGALSIVRFRTPIKEPEELGFLFLTIAIGLGFGAGFILITPVLTVSTLIILYIFKAQKSNAASQGQYTFVITLDKAQYEPLQQQALKMVSAIKLTRFESLGERATVYYTASLEASFDLNLFVNTLEEIDPSVEIQLVENAINW